MTMIKIKVRKRAQYLKSWAQYHPLLKLKKFAVIDTKWIFYWCQKSNSKPSSKKLSLIPNWRTSSALQRRWKKRCQSLKKLVSRSLLRMLNPWKQRSFLILNWKMPLEATDEVGVAPAHLMDPIVNPRILVKEPSSLWREIERLYYENI